ncbi:MAG: DUF624 domain-containing protein [Oscillospiraceae bacterium]|nr:DUF624 domain-containing protein [Oscillospiraceae bacterium]
MSLFYNPQKSGRGVSKEEAAGKNKKPLQKFGEIFGGKFWQIMQLNMLYVLLCIPIITIGPATAALTHVMRKFILGQPIFVFSEFFGAFKKHFLRTVFLGLFSAIFILSLCMNLLMLMNPLTEFTETNELMLWAMVMGAGVVFFTLNTYIYPQIVCLNLSMRAMFKNAMILSFAGFKHNLITLLVFGAVLFIILMTLPFSLIALPLVPFAQIAFLSVFNVYPIIQKYIINPYYEESGMKNPEIPDFAREIEDIQNYPKKTVKQSMQTTSEKPNIFTDLGGKEIPINKKSVKTSGKVIK